MMGIGAVYALLNTRMQWSRGPILKAWPLVLGVVNIRPCILLKFYQSLKNSLLNHNLYYHQEL